MLYSKNFKIKTEYRTVGWFEEDRINEFMSVPLKKCLLLNLDFREIRKYKYNIVSTSYSSPMCIEYQIKTLRKFFKESFYFTVLDCNFDKVNCSKEILNISKQYKIGYIKLPDNPCGLRETSQRHGTSLTWAYRNFIRPVGLKYFGILDQDCFPVRDIYMSNYLNLYKIYGYTYYSTSKINYPKIGTRWTFHPCVNFFKFSYVKKYDLDFIPDWNLIDILDTGGCNWNVLYKDLDIKLFPKIDICSVSSKIGDGYISYLNIDNPTSWIHMTRSCYHYRDPKDKIIEIDGEKREYVIKEYLDNIL